jgi:carbon-monoxide dehydrogenase large subunit
VREFDLGRAVPRIEDAQLLRGRGRYTDDIVLPRQAHLYVLRSPHAAARIRSIDVAAAAAVPGVIAVLTGKDADKDGLGTFSSAVQSKRRDGTANFVPPYRVLALDGVRHVGEPVPRSSAKSSLKPKMQPNSLRSTGISCLPSPIRRLPPCPALRQSRKKLPTMFALS